MSFAGFLAQVGKILFGYGGGLIFLLASIAAVVQEQMALAVVLFIIAAILALFGVYSEREL